MTACAVVAVAIAALFAVVHLPAVRFRVVAWSLERLRSTLSIDMKVEQASYNLLALSGRLQGVTVSALGSTGAPFVVADDVHVDLSWSTWLGRVDIEAVEASGLRVTLIRNADGSLNLPAFRGSTGASTSRVPIGRLRLRDASVSYQDLARDWAVNVEGMTLSLDPGSRGVISGRLVTLNGPSVRVGDVESRATRLDGLVTYDGVSASFERLRYEAPEGRLELRGRLDSLWSAPRSDLEISGSLALSQLSSTVSVNPPLRGTVALEATVAGPLADPVVSASLDSDGISWRHIGPASLRARTAVTTSALTVDPVTVKLDGGTLTGRGRFAFASGEAEARTDWETVSAASILGRLAPFEVAARLSGRADLRWRTADGWSGLEMTAVNRSSPVAGFRAREVRLKPDTTGAVETREVRLTASAKATAVRQSFTRRRKPDTTGGVARDAVSLDGEMSLVATRGDWRLRHEHRLDSAARIAGDSAGRLTSAGLGSTQLSGPIVISADDLSRAVPLARTMGLTLPEWARPGAGRLESELRLGGTLESPTLAGYANLNDVRLAEAGPIQVESHILLSTRRISVDRVQASLGANHATASGTVDFGNRALQATVGIALPDLMELAIGGLRRWRPSGTLSGNFDVGGVTSRPIVRGGLAGADLAIAGQLIASLSAGIDYDGGVLAVRRLELQQPHGGQLTVDAQFAPETSAYGLNATARAISVQPVVGSDNSWPVSAHVDGQFEGRGTFDHPRGTGRVTLTTLNWDKVMLGPTDVTVTLSDEGAHVDATLSELSTTIAATVELRSPRSFNVVAEARETDVTRIARHIASSSSIAASLQGRVSLMASATGVLDDLAGASAEADLRQLEVRAGDAPLQLVRPAMLRYADRSLAIDQLQLRAGSTLIEASGQVGQAGSLQSLDTSARGELGDLRPWLSLFGVREDIAVGGAVSANLSATGPIDRLTLAGTALVQDGTVAAAKYPAVTGVAISVNLSDGVIDVSRLDARWEGATLDGRLTVPLRLLSAWLPRAVTSAPALLSSDLLSSEAAFTGRIDGITAAGLAPFLGDRIRETLEGAASVTLDLRADMLALERVRGTLTMDELLLRAAGVPVTQLRPTQLVIADGRVHVADWTWEASGNPLSVAGRATLIGTRDLDLRAVGQIDLRLIGAFVPQVTTAGLAEVSVNVGGSLTSPLANGSLQIRGAELRVAEPQIAASNVDGRLLLRGQRLLIEDLQGSLNGGRFTAAGDVQHERFRLTGGALALTGTGVALNVPEGVRTDVDPALTLTFSDDRTRLSGRIAVQRGAYRQPLSLAAGFLSAARQRNVDTTSLAPPSTLDRVELEVAIVSSDDLVVDNNYGRMDVGLDLRLVGTVAQPSVVGRATIREGGVLYLGGRTYQIERGTIDFTNPRQLVPDLDLTARTRVAEYDLTINIKGTPGTVRTTVSSDSHPELAQADKVSLLATGRLADQVGGATTQVAAEQLLGYLSGEALGFAARAVGLDTLRLERGAGVEELQSDASLIAGDVDPSARLTVSKQFSRYIDVVLSQNLREGGRLTWIVTYTLRRDVELRGVSRDDRSRSYEARHNLSFGGPQRLVGRNAATRAASNERIAAIRFVGEPGFPLPALRRELKLRAGDRFDFYRWQQDRERLRRFYLDRGYLETRVSARRLDEPGAADEPGIALEYEIDRGPLARFDVEGYTLPPRVIRELETLWSNAVFDEALFDDLGWAVRRYLAEEGFLQARVTVSLQGPAAAGEKRIRIGIVPGERTRSREIRFDGVRELPEDRLKKDRLDALIASKADAVEAWLQPAALGREVTALYREEGFLAVRVTAGPAEFLGDRAVLPVRITEGPAFVVSRVSLSGVEARSEADVRRAFDLEPGARYRPGDVERGRSAVEFDYTRHGFNAVRATVATETNLASGTVQVTLTVEEGPRQILDSVVVEGGGGLNADVIADTLKLEPGTPVDMDAWYQSRRRLLDTGLFRRVDIEAVPAVEAAPAPGTEPVQARVSVERRPLWQLRYGLSVVDEPAPASEGRAFGAGLTADLQRRSLFGRAGTLGGALRVNRDHQIGRSYVTFPSLFTWPVITNLFVSRSHRKIEEAGFRSLFIEDKTSFTAEQRFRPTPSTQVSYGYQLERNHTFDPNPNPNDPIPLDLLFTAARLTSTTIVDTRNDPFDAVRGLFHSSNVEYAPEALGSDLRFAKYSLQQFLYFPIRGPLLTASGLRLGLGRGFGQELIPTERFFAGGVNTVRGYAENSLGGRDSLGEPRGGEAMVIVNQELRFPIFRWVRGVGFVDAGNVFDRVRDLSFTDLVVGTGAGLRFSTPAGLFRLDLGVPLSRANGKRTPRWHFSFGQMF